MKQGLTYNALKSEIKRQDESKRDFIINTATGHVNIVPTEDTKSGSFAFSFMNSDKKKRWEEFFPLNRFALSQIGTHTKVPMSVIDNFGQGSERERQALANLLTVSLKENETHRLVRTMENKKHEAYMRAFLSDTYRVLDNMDLAHHAIIPVFDEITDLQIVSCDVSDEAMYIKAINPDQIYNIAPKQARVGDIVEAGVVIKNSEVGSGRLIIEPFFNRKACMNGMISNDASMARRHIGRKNSLMDEWDPEFANEIYTDETKFLDDLAFFNKVKDTLHAMFLNDEKFMKILGRLMEAKKEPITGHSRAAVTEVTKRFQLSAGESESVYDELVRSGDLTKFGLTQAITAVARDDGKKMTYQRATELERVGGSVIELQPHEWKVISTAKVDKKAEKVK